MEPVGFAGLVDYIRARNANTEQYVQHWPTEAGRETHNGGKHLKEHEVGHDVIGVNTHSHAHVGDQISERISGGKYCQTDNCV